MLVCELRRGRDPEDSSPQLIAELGRITRDGIKGGRERVQFWSGVLSVLYEQTQRDLPLGEVGRLCRWIDGKVPYAGSILTVPLPVPKPRPRVLVDAPGSARLPLVAVPKVSLQPSMDKSRMTFNEVVREALKDLKG
jgi:hypothetical protein